MIVVDSLNFTIIMLSIKLKFILYKGLESKISYKTFFKVQSVLKNTPSVPVRTPGLNNRSSVSHGRRRRRPKLRIDSAMRRSGFNRSRCKYEIIL